MSFYENLETVTNKMALTLLNNKDFTKYLEYTDDDPLSHEDVVNPLGLLNRKFYLQPKPDELQTEEGIIIEMFFGGDNPSRTDGGLSTEYVITFNIMCHIGSWGITGGIRPYRLLNIIDSSFNGKRIPQISHSAIRPLGSKFMKFADGWNGYKIAYLLSWNGNSDC